MISPLLQSLAAFIHQPWAVDAAVRNAAGTHQHAVAGSAGEVTPAAHRAVVLPLGAPELQPQPKPRGKVRRAQVTDEGHLVGAAEQDLHPHVEAHLSVRAGRGAGPRCAPGDAAEGAPASAVRVGATSSFFFFWWIVGKIQEERLMRKCMQCERISQK